jgi:hypothetical protein
VITEGLCGRRLGVPEVVYAKSGPTDLADDTAHRVERFQFSRPRRDPLGEVIAGWSGNRAEILSERIGITGSGTGMDRWPAADFGFPSVSLPPTSVIERLTRIRLASRSTSDADPPGLEIDVFDAQADELANLRPV